MVRQPKVAKPVPIARFGESPAEEPQSEESATASNKIPGRGIPQSPVLSHKTARGRPLEVVLERLRTDIQQLAREREESKNEEDLSEHMEEDFADINVVETRSSSSQRETPTDAEEDFESMKRLLQQKDDMIEQLQQQMREMSAAIAALQHQPQISKEVPPEVIHISDGRKEVASVNRDEQLKRESGQSLIPEKDIKSVVEQQVREALAQSKNGASIPTGRPYPEEFDAVQYPKGFVPPLFKTFDGTGNPRQHVAHFRASCCNAGGSDALLFRQFVSSLSGIAFDWYAELPNSSVKTFAELENLFVKRFAGARHHITIGDLVVESQRPNETLVDYILRWRNLSMKCEPQLQEQHAIGILLKSIHGPIALLLKGFTIKTFEKLLSKAGSLQEEAKQLSFIDKSDKPKPVKAFEKRSGVVATVDKGKQPVQIRSERPQPVYQRPPSNYLPPHQIYQQPQQNYQSPQSSYQLHPVNHRPPQHYNQPPFQQRPTMAELLAREYPFKNDAVAKMFRSLSKKSEFRLPEPKRPEEVDKKEHPLYCPYHRMLGHKIEDCVTFKNWLEANLRNGNITIPKEYMKEPQPGGSVNVISVEPIVPMSSCTTTDGQNTAWIKSPKSILEHSQTTPVHASVQNSRPVKPTLSFAIGESSQGETKTVEDEEKSEAPKSRVGAAFPRLVLSDSGEKILEPVTLYDYLFAPMGYYNDKSYGVGYVLTVSDECVTSINQPNPDCDFDTENDSQIIHDHNDSNKEDDIYKYGYDSPGSEEFICEFHGAPFAVELELSDSETTPEESVTASEEITEVYLRRGKVQPQGTAPANKGKQTVTQEETNPAVEEPPVREEINEPTGKVEYNVLAHLRKLPAKLSIYDALILSKEMRENLVKALLDPEICLAQMADNPLDEVCSFKGQSGITFTDDDLLLGTADHNRPLYISVTIGSFTLSRVLVDPGASLNVMSLRTLAYLEIDARELAPDRMLLKGFNQKGEQALGSITLAMKIGDLTRTTAKFHIIDTETSFNALLGRPWLHEYRLVPSSLHQCIKYYEDGQERCIKGDLQPFSVHEVGVHEDAAYYAPPKKSVFSRNTVQNKERATTNIEEPEVLVQQPLTTPLRRDGESFSRARIRDRGRGRDRGRNSGIVGRKEVVMKMNWENSSEEEEKIENSITSKNQKKPQLEVSLEDEKKEKYKSMYEKINGYVKTMTLTPTSSNKVESLVVKEVRGAGAKPIKFYRGASSSDSVKDVQFEDVSSTELMELPFEWYSPCVQNLIQLGLISKQWTKDQAQYFERLWNNAGRPPNSKQRSGVRHGRASR